MVRLSRSCSHVATRHGRQLLGGDNVVVFVGIGVVVVLVLLLISNECHNLPRGPLEGVNTMNVT